MGLTQERKSLLAQLALLLAGAIWGSGFVVMKNSLDTLPVNYLLAFRFTLAAVGLSLLLHARFRSLRKPALLAGALCGALMFAAYSVQTYGLSLTTSGKNAFLTAVYVVIVPFLFWALYRRRPTRGNIAAALLCLAGVGLVALKADLSVNTGDALTLLCGLLYAAHIVAVSIFSANGEDIMTLTLVQFISSAICAWLVAAFVEPFPALALASPGVLVSLLYLGLICTLLALTLQNVGLKYAPPAHASLLMSTEAPFGYLFGILLLDEPFTPRIAAGFLLIAAAIVISELAGRSKRQPAG